MPQLKGPVPQVQAKEGPMPQLVKKRRSGWAVLAAGALIASLLAVGSAPAGAAEIKAGDANKAEPTKTSNFSACVGAATEDAGFTDLGTLDVAAANINCLVHYDIAAGTSADTFDPDSNVTRSQMALFLYAAAGKAGIDLSGGDMSADFGDIADLAENRQNAIQALARNGILMGRGDMAFDPTSDITRAEMAAALVAFVRHASPHLFVQRGVNAGALIIAPGDLDYFADARSTVPRGLDTTISYAYELGITGGYPDGTFRPNDGVPRRNMATFITAALAHSTARPVGLTVQSVNGTLHASLRDADHKAVAGERVDAFYTAAAREDRAFDEDGRCRSIVSSVESAGDQCRIDRLDPITNSQGDAEFERLTASQVGRGLTVWAWTSHLNDRFDHERAGWYRFEQGPISSPNAADRAVVLPSQAGTPHVRFGDSVEMNLQLQYLDDRRTPGTGDDVYRSTSKGTNPAAGGATYDLVYAIFDGVATELIYDLDSSRELRIVTARGHDDETPDLVDPEHPDFALIGTTTSLPADSALTGVPLPTRRGHVQRTVKETHTTDENGRLTFDLTTHDPSPASNNDYRTVAYVLIPRANAPKALDKDGKDMGAHHGWAVFSEAAPYLSVLSASARFPYDEKALEGSPVGNRVTVTALNQYHEPLGGMTVGLTSNRNHDTNRDGDFGGDAVDRGVTGGTPNGLEGLVDAVDDALDGNNDGDFDDLGTDINNDGAFADIDGGAHPDVNGNCHDLNRDGDNLDPGERPWDADGSGSVRPANEGCRYDIAPVDAAPDSSDITVIGYESYGTAGHPDADVWVSRFPGARATSTRSGTAQFAFSHVYHPGDPHSPGAIGNNRETIEARPASDDGPPTAVRKVKGIMRYGVFIPGTLASDGTFTPDSVAANAAQTACTNGSYEYYANFEHIDDDGESESTSKIPDDDDFGATDHTGAGTAVNFAPVLPGVSTTDDAEFFKNDIAGRDQNDDDDFEDADDRAPGRTPNQVDPTREATVFRGRCAMTTVDWHRATTNTNSGGDRSILSGSLDNREIIVHWGDVPVIGDEVDSLEAIPRLVRYDENDVFENLANPGDIIEIAEFEELLARVIDPDNPQPSSGTLAWRYYDHLDRDDRTLFQLDLTPIGD